MTSEELDRFKRILTKKQAELEEDLRSRQDIVVIRSADPLDETRDAIDREIAVQSLGQGFVMLRDVQSAIQRIADGSFGVCANCGEQIAYRRLAAVPWTSLCLHCQEAAEGPSDVRKNKWVSVQAA